MPAHGRQRVFCVWSRQDMGRSIRCSRTRIAGQGASLQLYQRGTQVYHVPGLKRSATTFCTAELLSTSSDRAQSMFNDILLTRRVVIGIKDKCVFVQFVPVALKLAEDCSIVVRCGIQN